MIGAKKSGLHEPLLVSASCFPMPMAKYLSVLLVAGILAFALALGGCSKKEEPASQPPPTPSPAPATPPAAVSKETASGNAAKGKKIFSNSCSGCHGSGGKGDGAAAAALNPKPKDLTDKTYVSKLNDDYLHNVIAKGGAAVGKSALMPPFGGSLKDQDIRDVVAFIRTLAK